MFKTHNVSVAVDLSKTDDKVLRYTQYLADKMKIKKLNLIHVISSLLSPGNADWEVHEILGAGFNLKNKIKDKISTTSNFIFQNGLTTEIEILEGNPFREFIARAEDLNTDLVVVGRKNKSEGSGITAQKIARNFKKNVLFVPPSASLNISRISVPIDFSENSVRALQLALDLSSQIKNSTVRCVHVVNSAPESYYLDLKTRNEIDTHLQFNAENAWGMFLEKNGWKKKIAPIDFIQNHKTNTANLLDDYFKTQQSDLVIVGAKGHTAFENFLYGSVTESLVDRWEGSPVLIVR